MLKKATLPSFTAKKLSKFMSEEKVTFDNVVQRNLVWDKKRKSLLIHSMMVGYPIPPFYSARTEQGYDFLDGKQRSNAIHEFLTDQFKLESLDDVTLEDGTIYSPSGKLFSELPDELKEEIQDYGLTIYYFENITQDEIIEMFARLNNGKPLSAIELTRVKAENLEQIKTLAEHNLFCEAMSAKQLNGYKNEDIVIKSAIVMYNENKALDTKYVRPIVENMKFTDEQLKEMNEVFNRIVDVHGNIEYKGEKKTAKKVYTMTHLISMSPIVLRSIREGIDIESFTAFINRFFSPTDKTCIDEVYNNSVSAGANKAVMVTNRLNALEASYNDMFGKRPTQCNDSKQQQENTQEEIKENEEIEGQEQEQKIS